MDLKKTAEFNRNFLWFYNQVIKHLSWEILQQHFWVKLSHLLQWPLCIKTVLIIENWQEKIRHAEMHHNMLWKGHHLRWEPNDSSSKDLATPSKAPRSPSPHKSQEMWIAFSTCGKQIQVRKNCPLALQCKRQRSRVQLFYLISPTLSSSKLKNIDLSEPGPFPPWQRKLVSKEWPTHLIYKAGMWAAPCRALRASYPGTRFSSAEWETDKAKQQAYR